VTGIIIWIEMHQGTAAWLQAFASVAAIVWAGWSARQLQRASLKQARITRTDAVHAISNAAAKRVAHVVDQLRAPDAISGIAQGWVEFDSPALREIENGMTSILLYALETPELVTNVMTATLRQFRENVEAALRLARQMDTKEFSTFIDSNRKMLAACDDITHRIEGQRKLLEKG
jgi:hypothetical protein